jgi:hypothetical protein
MSREASAKYAVAKFKAWAVENGVSLDHEDDFKPWFECFMTGWGAAVDHIYEERTLHGKEEGNQSTLPVRQDGEPERSDTSPGEPGDTQ